ncbi:MAG: TonB-dependent receptor [Sphingomonas sp.]|nr:TonB-dependent receptor [Sphingomonas sp.]PZU07290.1 MAG: TonB-dependent receptor [Sphingomonas sp.]
MKKLLAGCAVSALVPAAVLAQSTGAVDFENVIVVTGSSGAKSVAGVQIPQTARTKGVLTQDFIQHTTPGQSINDTINMLPGVSFQANDPFGSAGGTLAIRGFDSTRINQTFDGIPLNDTGSYEIYSNQQLDPELIEQVNVNLGTTDVDSPTAGASGSTVNYRSRNPTDDFHVRLQGSAGNYEFMRIFGMVDTGVFTPWGTKAWIAASRATNDAPYGHRGQISKKQFNAKVYQPIGTNGDFVSIAGHYNQNINNFFGSLPLRVDQTASPLSSTVRPVTSLSSGRQPLTKDERNYTIPICNVAVARAGQVDSPNTCGTSFDERYNPSRTGNVRINSRFTLKEGLVLTVDPSYQYTLANGGGTVTANEGLRDIDPSSAVVNLQPGYFGGVPYAGRDLNGDGDTRDTVTMAAPSNTQTHRYGVIASLRYDLSPDHTVRVAYTLDYGRHRQTGEVAPVASNGASVYKFTTADPLLGSNGSTLQKRDRLSKAILNQASAEYTGHFFQDLTITAGIRAPFMQRKLDQRCFTSSITGFVECFGDNPSAGAIAAATAANPYTVSAAGVPSGWAIPQKRTLKYNKVLPSAGFIYRFTPAIAVHGNYSKGLQVPGTDNLYNSFYYPLGTSPAKPKPETSDNFDLGVRYTSSKIQAELSAWYTRFNNRLSQSYDPTVDRSVYTNLGRVDRYGIDGSISYSPIREISVYAFGSYLKSKIKDNVQAGSAATTTCAGVERGSATTTQLSNCFFTEGKRESLQPVYTIGGRVQANLDPVTFGVDVKRTGRRYVNDQNLPYFLCTGSASASGLVCSGTGAVQYMTYGAFIKGYTLVNLDARISLEPLVHNDRTWLQFNVTNLFDKLFVGGSTTKSVTSVATTPFFQIGTPRGISGTLNVGF